MKLKKTVSLLCAAVVVMSVFAGCGQTAVTNDTASEECEEIIIEDINELLDDDAFFVPLGSAPVPLVLMPEASGKTVYGNQKATIDASNLADGYFMVKYLEKTTNALKVIVECPSGVKYSYNLTASDKYETFPLSDGNGSYKIGIYKNTTGTKYSVSYSTSIDVKLKDEFAPFVYPNQYVNYTADSKVVAKGEELTANCKDELECVKAVYEYVVGNFTYDHDRAENVTSGYLPVLDSVLAEKKGICFDYAAVMSAMLRSQGIPCKLVVGYAGKIYHAWINVYSEKEGWINSAIYFDGTDWKLMDPTFASSSKESASTMKYIGDGKNYSPKYLY